MGSHSLCKATKIIGETLYPDFLVRATGELTVIEVLAGVGVNDRVVFADGYLSNGEGVLVLAVGEVLLTVACWVSVHR